jgi:flagellar biosynthetic protein FliO
MTYYPDFFTSAFKMFSALLLVLGILLGCFYLMRRLVHREGIAAGTKSARIIERTPIGVKKNITIVAVADRVLVLGVTHDRISLLTEIEDQDSVERLTNRESEGISASFTSHLSRLLKKARQGDGGPQTSPSQVTLN